MRNRKPTKSYIYIHTSGCQWAGGEDASRTKAYANQIKLSREVTDSICPAISWLSWLSSRVSSSSMRTRGLLYVKPQKNRSRTAHAADPKSKSAITFAPNVCLTFQYHHPEVNFEAVLLVMVPRPIPNKQI